MIKFLSGIAFGIFLATAGTSGVAMLIDSSVSKFQNTIKESVREQHHDTINKLNWSQYETLGCIN